MMKQANLAKYEMELVSAESDSGEESTVVRGITYKPSNAVRRQKHYRRPKEVEKYENFKRFGISVCILLVSALVLWVLVLSMLLAELFKRTVELQNISGRTAAQTNELTMEIQSWRNFSKTVDADQNLHMAKMSDFEREMANVTLRLSKLEKKLVVVEEKESRPQQLFNMVQEQVSTLTSSIAGLNSEVENLKSKLADFRDDEDRREHVLLNLKVNVSIMAKTISKLNKTVCDARSINHETATNASALLSQAVESIRPELTAMNESLSKRLRYLSEDQEKDHKLFIELQESLANLSSQVISLLRNTDAWRTNFNNLELKILTIRQQFKALQVKPHEKPTSSPNIELTGIPSCDDYESTVESRTIQNLEDQPNTLQIGITSAFSKPDVLPSAPPSATTLCN